MLVAMLKVITEMVVELVFKCVIATRDAIFRSERESQVPSARSVD